MNLDFEVEEYQETHASILGQSKEHSRLRSLSANGLQPLYAVPRTKMISNGSQNTRSTQELSQWMIDESKKSNATDNPNTDNVQGVTYTPGKTGHVDLEVHVQHTSGFDTQEGELRITPQHDVHAELFPESRRFKQPETPAPNGGLHGEVKEPGTVFTTPRLPSNPFAKQAASDTGVMGLTQVFKNTQALSSPTAARIHPVPSSDLPSPGIQIAQANDLPSDIVSDNISPLLASAKRPLTAPAHSSPTKMVRATLQRAITEPHTQYISRKMSQEERRKRTQHESVSSPIDKDSAIADAVFEDTRDVERRNKRRRITQESKAIFDSITAPPRPATGKESLSRAVLHQRSIRGSPTPRRKNGEVVVISDEANDNDSEEDETEPENGSIVSSLESEDDDAGENKENRNHSRVQVPMTGLRIKRAAPPHLTRTVSSPAARHKARILEKDGSEDELANGYALQTSGTSRPPAVLFGEVPPLIIADSQSSQKKFPRPLPMVRNGTIVSSNDSRNVISQSQMGKGNASSEMNSGITRHVAATSSQQTASPPPTSSPPNPQKGLYHPPGGLQDSSNGPVQQPLISPKSSPPPLPQRSQSEDPNDEQTEAEDKAIVDDDLGEDHPDVEVIRQPSLEISNNSLKASNKFRPHPLEHISSSQKATLPSTIPETTSRHSHETHAFDRNQAVSRTGNGTAHRLSNSKQVLNNIEVDSDRVIGESSDARSVMQSPQSLHSPRQIRNPVARTPKSRSPRKPKPFTSITAEAPVEAEEDSDDIDIGVLKDHTGYAEQMERLEGSDPVSPTRKRRRGINGRPIVAYEPSSLRKPDSPAQSRSRGSNEQANAPSTEQEYELPNGIRTSPISDRRLPATASKNWVAYNDAVDEPKQADRSFQTDQAPAHSKVVSKKPSAQPSIATSKVVPPALNNSKHAPAQKRGNGTRLHAAEKPLKDSTPSISRLDLQIITAPTRIFAHFNGTPEGYFAATCLGVIPDGLDQKYKVRFDDGTTTIVNKVKRLELQEGDSVKIYRVGYRSQAFIVTGFQRDVHSREARSDSQYPQTDILGNHQIKVRPKAKRDAAEIGPEELVPLTEIYLTGQMWSSFKNRDYTHPFSHVSSGLQTPQELSSSPSTPQSRMRSAKTASNLSSNQRAITASKSMVQQTSDLFARIVFAMTTIANEHLRTQTQHAIFDNSGQLLADGFEELFDIPTPKSFSSKIKSSSSSHPSSSAVDSTPSKATFSLTESASGARFALLLADTHCRTTKYFQALALGIPCIHTRWVADCVRAGKLQDWRPYLLASGESAFLHKAVCSRVLSFDHRQGGEVALDDMVHAREKWLKDNKVLLVGDSKAAEKVISAYVFIAYALGAGEVGIAGNRKEAEDVLKGKHSTSTIGGREWDWVCVAEDEKDSASTLGGKKRKRSGGKETGTAGSVEIEALRKCTKAKVVGTETVVQSLILGRLWEE